MMLIVCSYLVTLSLNFPFMPTLKSWRAYNVILYRSTFLTSECVLYLVWVRVVWQVKTYNGTYTTGIRDPCLPQGKKKKKNRCRAHNSFVADTTFDSEWERARERERERERKRSIKYRTRVSYPKIWLMLT